MKSLIIRLANPHPQASAFQQQPNGPVAQTPPDCRPAMTCTTSSPGGPSTSAVRGGIEIDLRLMHGSMRSGRFSA